SCRLFSRLYIGYEHGLSYNDFLRRTFLWRRRIFWCRWPRIFLPGHMGGSVVLGLTAISVVGFIPKLFVELCVIRAEAGNISNLKLIKFLFSKKNIRKKFQCHAKN